jgi:hypothetical protein
LVKCWFRLTRVLTNTYHMCPLSMHGSLFALCNLFLCVGLSPDEPAIITSRYAKCYMCCYSTCHQQQSHQLGNDFQFFHSLKIWVYLLSRFNLSLLVVSANIFHEPFFIFYLDKQHPVWVMILPISEVGSSHRFLLPLCLNVLLYTHVSVGVFMRTPFFLSRLVDSIGFGWMDHLWIPGRISKALR